MFKIPIETWLWGVEEHRIRTGRPYITLSWAQSLDGSISARRGTPLALSGGESLKMTHQLRAAHQAIAVGIGTVISDDPQLTVRLVEGRDPQPVVLDSRLSFPLQARLLENPNPPWIAAVDPIDPEKEAKLINRGARVLQLPPDAAGRVGLNALLENLADSNINSILIEGGAGLLTNFLQCRLADWIVITIAPIFVGGLQVVERMLSPMPRLKDFASTHIGEDLVLWGAPEW